VVFHTLQKDNVVEELIVGFEKYKLHKHIFDPLSVLHLIDLEGGKLNYEAKRF
jgi:hypothetical protein